MELLDKVRQTVQRYHLAHPGSRVVVALSGGPDSVGLAYLARELDRSGELRLVGLGHLNHQLRANAERDERFCGRVADALGYPLFVECEDVAARARRERRSMEDAARTARYEFFERARRRFDADCVAVAHTRDDQAETVLLRLGRGSGVDGLAGMAAEVHLAELRLLRPLLAVPKAVLEATLIAMKQAWVVDPGNLAGTSARSRVRLAAAALARDGITPARLAATARRLGRARQALEGATATLLARAVHIHPAGFLRIDPGVIRQAPDELRLRALARCLMAVSGAAYGPRLERLERLDLSMLGGDGAARGHTLHGCRLVVLRDGWLVCREASAMEGGIKLQPDKAASWDGRFHIPATGRSGLALAALGADAALPALRASAREAGVPRLVVPTLPAFSDRKGLLAVPALRWNRGQGGGHSTGGTDRIVNYSALFMPRAQLAPAVFAVAPAAARTI
jgi:tRNA(Ile)-lysidine synthase